MALVRREQGTLRWPVLRDALWLRSPRAPRTGRRGGKLWLVVLPLIVASAVEGLLVIPGPAGRDFAAFLGSDAAGYVNGVRDSLGPAVHYTSP